jgi:hypothetical protein
MKRTMVPFVASTKVESLQRKRRAGSGVPRLWGPTSACALFRSREVLPQRGMAFPDRFSQRAIIAPFSAPLSHPR